MSLAHKTTSLKMGIKNSANRSSFFELIFKQGAAASFSDRGTVLLSLAHKTTSLKMGIKNSANRSSFLS